MTTYDILNIIGAILLFIFSIVLIISTWGGTCMDKDGYVHLTKTNVSWCLFITLGLIAVTTQAFIEAFSFL